MNTNAQTNRTMEYNVGFVNKTGRLLDAVAVDYGDIETAAAGLLVKGGKKTYGPIETPIPSEVKVHWIDNGEPHAVVVKLEGLLPKRLTDEWTLYFVINSNTTVQAKTIKITDRRAMDELEKGLRPEGEYRFAFVNKTGRDIEDVSVNQGTTQISRPNSGGGDVPARFKVAFSDALLPPIPSEVELRWNEEGGTSHAVKVRLNDVPKGFEGRIFFVIKADGTVEVHPVKNGDDKEAFKVEK